MKTPAIDVWENKSQRKYIHSFSARITHHNGIAYFIDGGAASTYKNVAMNKAVFEALERYSGSKIPKNLKKWSYQEMHDILPDPKTFIFFAPEQYKSHFPYKKFSNALPIEWAQGLFLSKNRLVYIPAFTVYLGYNRKVSSEEKFFPSSSSGLAIHKTFNKAAIHGILELIERDAAMHVWIQRLSPPRIDLSSLRTKRLINLLDKIKREGLIAEVILTSHTLPIPSFVSVIYCPNSKIPFATFGLSAEIADLEKGIKKALEEALMIRCTLEHIEKTQGAQPFRKKQSRVESFLDHTLYYAHYSRKKYWQFMFTGPVITLNEAKKLTHSKTLSHETLSNLVSLLNKFNYDIYVVDVTSDLAKLMKLVCVKVIVPQLRQMEINHNFNFFKYQEKNAFKSQINKYPHPFG